MFERGKRFSLSSDLLFLMDQSEKRLYKRLEVNLPVDLVLDGSTVRATTTNISCGGLFLKVDPDQINQKENLNLLIYLPNRSNPVKTTAQVLRFEKKSPEGIALKFHGLFDDNTLAIEQFIKSHLH